MRVDSVPIKFAILAAYGLLGAVTAEHAQPYPTKPVRMVVAFAAGGVADIMTRVVSARLSEI
jgi:tripartite-type tricarboxylate transporter receptor subunit TctC